MSLVLEINYLILSYLILLATLTVNYEFYVIVLVIPHNIHNNVASVDVFTCV